MESMGLHGYVPDCNFGISCEKLRRIASGHYTQCLGDFIIARHHSGRDRCGRNMFTPINRCIRGVGGHGKKVHCWYDAWLIMSQVWTSDTKQTVRGVICSPWEVKPFEISVNGPSRPQVSEHATTVCRTTYSNNSNQNPITGIS